MTAWRNLLAPALLGVALLVIWEVACRAIPIPQVLLPAPSVIAARIATEIPLLGYDFFKTVLQAVIPGWVIAAVTSGGTVPRFSPTTTAPAREASRAITASSSSSG